MITSRRSVPDGFPNDSQLSAHGDSGANVRKFCERYFKSEPLDLCILQVTAYEEPSKAMIVYYWLLEYLVWLRGVMMSFGGSNRVSWQQRRYQRVFIAVAVVGILTNAASLVLSIADDAANCNVVIPTAEDDCCSCVCNINTTWCATSSPAATSLTIATNATVPLSYGNFFSGNNSVSSMDSQRTSATGLVYLCSLAFVFVELGWGILSGNWYMLLCVYFALVLQTARSIFLHAGSNEAWDKNSSYSDLLKSWRLVMDIASCIACLVLLLILPFLRAGFNTLQFQKFGGVIGHQSTIRYYNIMFAMVLFDWQTSSVFYSQLVAVSQTNSGMSSLLIMMYYTDVLSVYLSYLYIRFENKWESAIAFGTKLALALCWIGLAVYYFGCFSAFKSRAIYLRSQLIDSQYLGVTVSSAEKFLLGSCNVSPAVSASGDLLMISLYLVVAFVARCVGLFYAGLLWIDFGKGTVSSLFFDIVSAKQNESVALPSQDVDTIDNR